MSESASVEAITLARAAFSSAQGDLGLIKFSVEELVPSDKSADMASRTWELTCSFYENMGSPTPTKYKAIINLDSKTVSIKKMGGGDVERTFTVTEQGGSTGGPEAASAPGESSPDKV